MTTVYRVTAGTPAPNPDPTGDYTYAGVGNTGENVYGLQKGGQTWYVSKIWNSDDWVIGPQYYVWPLTPPVFFDQVSYGPDPPTSFFNGINGYTGVVWGELVDVPPPPGKWWPWCCADCPVPVPEPAYVCGCENCSVLARIWLLTISGSTSRDPDCAGNADGEYPLPGSYPCGWMWSNHCNWQSGDPLLPNPIICNWMAGFVFVSDITLGYESSGATGQYVLRIDLSHGQVTGGWPVYECKVWSRFHFRSAVVDLPPICNDLMLDMSNARKIKSAGGGCTLEGVGNRVCITGGMGWTPGCYEIIAEPDGDGWTELLTAPGPAGAAGGEGGMCADCVRPFLGPDGRLNFIFIEEEVLQTIEPGGIREPADLSGATIKATVVEYQQEP